MKPLGFIGRPEKFENQRAEVHLSQFTPGQDRCLFLRCRVNGDEPDVARVNVNYTDELGGGGAQLVSGAARIEFTDDQRVSDKSVDGTVYAEKQLMLTAVAKDQAREQADAGNYSAAAKILTVQNAALGTAYASAPGGVQFKIRAETNYLNDFSRQLDGGAYDGSVRKSMQEQSFNTRNSK